MNELIRSLNDKIVINDLIVRRMKYEINMLFYDKPSKERARELAKKINEQIDNSLVGVNEADKESIRRLLIVNSFMVIPNPTSDHINYGHVFTTLTNFDDDDDHTKARLMRWLDLNTEFTYEEESLTQYIKSYKINSSGKIVKTAATTYEPPERTYERPSKEPSYDDVIYKYKPTKRAIIIPIVILLAILLYSLFVMDTHDHHVMDFIEPEAYHADLELVAGEYIDQMDKVDIKIIPDEYFYKDMNLKAVYEYLNEKNSKLVEDDYLTTITRLSKKHYVNPYLLIAIIGQEQSYVPKDHEYADEIINNPYNVFGSWQDYNTNFEDATQICLNTIDTALRNRPEDVDLIEFLNNKYSEDENWYIGVKTIYASLNKLE
ncbi:hypothetical protein EZV73_14460 [Acidaminobacter sp. JC074]|uniref:hypothetical protein n=1 Tax=Acidaminobacter sp. JC074 TaxID=2530199 RepID=UPI001F11811A|nr:hypothetical protein [Acidaminobacter sp. JC074]MCH4888794.1 hypothetical protein [Acidaminobacter sp. JC074]